MSGPSTHASLLERLAGAGNRPDDQEAWLIFAERYGPLIRDYGRRRGLQPSDCDDLLQDVLLSLTKALPGFRYDPAKGRLRAYLKTVAMRSISRKARQERTSARLEEIDEPTADEDSSWEEAWRQYHLRLALDRLRAEFPERTRTAFQLYVLEGREASETAELLGMPIASIYQAKSRVLRRVSDLVAQQVNEEG